MLKSALLFNFIYFTISLVNAAQYSDQAIVRVDKAVYFTRDISNLKDIYRQYSCLTGKNLVQSFVNINEQKSFAVTTKISDELLLLLKLLNYCRGQDISIPPMDSLNFKKCGISDLDENLRDWLKLHQIIADRFSKLPKNSDEKRYSESKQTFLISVYKQVSHYWYGQFGVQVKQQ